MRDGDAKPPGCERATTGSRSRHAVSSPAAREPRPARADRSGSAGRRVQSKVVVILFPERPTEASHPATTAVRDGRDWSRRRRSRNRRVDARDAGHRSDRVLRRVDRGRGRRSPAAVRAPSWVGVDRIAADDCRWRGRDSGPRHPDLWYPRDVGSETARWFTRSGAEGYPTPATGDRRAKYYNYLCYSIVAPPSPRSGETRRTDTDGGARGPAAGDRSREAAVANQGSCGSGATPAGAEGRRGSRGGPPAPRGRRAVRRRTRAVTERRRSPRQDGSSVVAASRRSTVSVTGSSPKKASTSFRSAARRWWWNVGAVMSSADATSPALLPRGDWK